MIFHTLITTPIEENKPYRFFVPNQIDAIVYPKRIRKTFVIELDVHDPFTIKPSGLYWSEDERYFMNLKHVCFAMKQLITKSYYQIDTNMIFREITHLNLSAGDSVMRLPQKTNNVITESYKNWYCLDGPFLGYDSMGLYGTRISVHKRIHEAMVGRIYRDHTNMIFHQLRPLELVVGQQVKARRGMDCYIDVIVKYDKVCQHYPYGSDNSLWWTKCGLYFSDDERAITFGSVFHIKQLICNKLDRIYDIP
jgi:hypothetical protein